jgi:hypothetical protein
MTTNPGFFNNFFSSGIITGRKITAAAWRASI